MYIYIYIYHKLYVSYIYKHIFHVCIYMNYTYIMQFTKYITITMTITMTITTTNKSELCHLYPYPCPKKFYKLPAVLFCYTKLLYKLAWAWAWV